MHQLLALLFHMLFGVNLYAFDGYLVKLKPGPKTFLKSHQHQWITEGVIQIPKKELSFFSNNSAVLFIEPNHKISPDSLPNDLLKDQWGLYNPKGADINILEAWEKNTGSKKVVVAIVDTGVDTSHPDLADNLWMNTKEINGKAGKDDDGNGYIDDFHGWNVYDNSNDVYDYRQHGTHIAGIVGAKGNNSLGLVGVNWEVSLMAVNFFPKENDSTVAQAVKAIDYAIKNGAHIINASWGTHPNEINKSEFKILGEAIKRAEKKNILIIAAAGNTGGNNDNQGHIPASLENKNIISVGAITRFGWVPSFSNYGKKSVDIFAPGSVIKSTLPNNYYGNLNGTSMAAPFVSGVAALMLAQNPKMKWSAVKSKLLNSCTPNGNLTEHCQCQGHLNAGQALK